MVSAMQNLDSLKHLVDMAAGREPADLLIRNANVVNVFTGDIMHVPVAVGDGKFLGFSEIPARRTLDAHGRYLLPGLIDAHIHIESSMASPTRFAELVLPCGTTTVIADPHEVANVHGLDGIRYMLENGRGLPLNIFIALPSCVPATPYEDAGAVLGADDLQELIDDPQVSGIGEMMNFPGIMAGIPEVLAKVLLGRQHGKCVDGHAPGLLGQGLDTYLVSGVSNTHECTTLEEMEANLARGCYVLIREGSAAKNLRTLLPGVTDGNARRCAFCCDDIHPEDIARTGHMDHHLRLAVELGMDPIRAITLATLNAAECFGLNNKGAVAPGRDADFILVDDLQDFRVREVYTAGNKVAEDGKLCVALAEGKYTLPAGSVHIGPVTEASFALPVPGGKARIIRMQAHSLLSLQEIRNVHTDENGLFQCALNPDLTRAAVIERHKATGKIGLGLLAGYGLHGGAVATTIAHDSHNIVAAGDDVTAMCRVVDAIAGMGGGIAMLAGGTLYALPLPVAGLLTPEPPLQVAAQLGEMIRVAHDVLGIAEGIEPFMSLSFMALPVIPELKLTTRGLFDVNAFDFVDLAVE